MDSCQGVAVFGQATTKFFKLRPNFACRERLGRCVNDSLNVMGEARVHTLAQMSTRVIHEILISPFMLANQRREGIHCLSQGKDAVLSALLVLKKRLKLTCGSLVRFM